MSSPKYSYEQLLEKIIRARISLEGVSSRAHTLRCSEEDPESRAPCNCDASEVNRPIEDALRKLRL